MTAFHPTCRIALLATLAFCVGGCSIKRTAVNKLGDAIPFGLKTMEGLLEESPKHAGLLLATASGFVQYAYGWVQLEADYVEAKDLARATELRGRAQKLYLRAREYGLRGLELESPGLRQALQGDARAAEIGRASCRERVSRCV